MNQLAKYALPRERLPWPVLMCGQVALLGGMLVVTGLVVWLMVR